MVDVDRSGKDSINNIIQSFAKNGRLPVFGLTFC
jgi:hypothetical protein